MKIQLTLLKKKEMCNIIKKQIKRVEKGVSIVTSKIVQYNKLWKILVDKKMSKADLRKAIDLAPNTLTKLRRDDAVSLDVLRRICEYLDCDIGDVCEFVTAEEPEA